MDKTKEPNRMELKRPHYLTMKFQPEELDFIYEIRKCMIETYGHNLPLNAIARAMFRKGLENIDYAACLEEPTLLFEKRN